MFSFLAFCFLWLCRKGASELKTDEILFLVVVANAFTHAKSSTRHSLIILESCVPYTIHIQRVETGLNIIVLIEVIDCANPAVYTKKLITHTIFRPGIKSSPKLFSALSKTC